MRTGWLVWRVWPVVAVSLLVLAGPALAQDAGPRRFENATAGIAVSPPTEWHAASLQTVQENRERVQLSDAELQAAMQKASTAPLFVFMKYPEPHPDINPSIQITVRPLGALVASRPTEMMNVAVGSIRKAFADFVFVTPISDIQVSGLPGAHMRARYTMRNRDGSSFKVLTRLWLVPRGAYMFLIGMSGPQEGPDVSEPEFAAALASIKIQK
jgi:hypothetical protein